MNKETEQAIERLIRRHGLARVRESMSELISETTWNNWQRVDSAITNSANRIKRKIKCTT